MDYYEISKRLPISTIDRLIREKYLKSSNDEVENRKTVEGFLTTEKHPKYVEDFIFSLSNEISSKKGKISYQQIYNKDMSNCLEFFNLQNDQQKKYKNRIHNILRYQGLTEGIYSIVVIATPNYYIIRDLDSIPSDIMDILEKENYFCDEDTEEDFYASYDQDEEKEIIRKYAFKMSYIGRFNSLKTKRILDPEKSYDVIADEDGILLDPYLRDHSKRYKTWNRKTPLVVEEIDLLYKDGKQTAVSKENGLYYVSSRYRVVGSGGSKTFWEIGKGKVIQAYIIPIIGSENAKISGYYDDETHRSESFKKLGLLTNNSKLVKVWNEDEPEKVRFSFISDSFKSMREKGIHVIDAKNVSDPWMGEFNIFRSIDDVRDLNLWIEIMPRYFDDVIKRFSKGLYDTGDSLNYAIQEDDGKIYLRVLSYDFPSGCYVRDFVEKKRLISAINSVVVHMIADYMDYNRLNKEMNHFEIGDEISPKLVDYFMSKRDLMGIKFV